MTTHDRDNLLGAIRGMLEQQFQNTVKMQHGLLHQIYQQFEAFVTLNQVLEIRHPLPPMRGWAASPDFLVLVLGEILARRPDLVVELGSGVSTLVSAYALQRLGSGKLVSLDHDVGFLQKTRQQVDLHGLNAIVQTVHAPLTTTDLNGVKWQWYDLESVEIPGPVDILVVDGPPGDIQARSRYPALPAFAQYLSVDAVVLLDDAARPDEQAIAREWSMRFPEFACEFVSCEKGASILRRSHSV